VLLCVSILTNLIICYKLANPIPYNLEQTISNISNLSQSVENLSEQTNNFSEKLELTRKENNGGLLLMCLVASSCLLFQTLLYILSGSMGERKNYVFSFKAFSFSKRKAELFFTRWKRKAELFSKMIPPKGGLKKG
jgi:hypothetical protein